MIETRHACPDGGELQQLLEGTASDSRQQELTAHLDGCPSCQEKLEQLAVSGSSVLELVHQADRGRPDSRSAFWPALAKVRGDLVETLVPGPPASPRTPPPRDLNLDFLEAPSDPAYLGRLGHFEISRVVGRGGMGVVLEAFDSHLRRTVAIKVLDPELADDETSHQRFCREARAAAAITHDNVVAVHQVEKTSGAGLPFLVMQLIQGETLEARLAREKRLPLTAILRIGMQAAAGLAAAHSIGLIHRDVKPGNMLLEQTTGRMKLTDFGLARCIEDVKLTRTGFVTGTPLYMAPEQALGQEIDERADLFSLGAVLYEMCTGQPPFSGITPLAVLKQIAETTPRPVRALNPEIPAWLAELVQSLLAKRPDQRPISASEVAHILGDHLAKLEPVAPVEVPNVHTSGACQTYRKRRWRNSVTFLSVGILLGTGLALGIAWPFLGNRPVEPRVMTGPPPIATLAGNSGPVWSVAFSPRGDTLAMGIDDGVVKFWDVRTGQLKSTLRAHNGPVWAVSIASSGGMFATGHDDQTVRIWDMSRETELRSFQVEGPVRTLAFAPRGNHLAVGTRTGKVSIWDADSGTKVLDTKGHEGVVVSVAFSPDGTLLGSASGDKTARLWNAENGRERTRLEGHSGGVYGIAFSADSRMVATGGWDHAVRLWETATGNPLGALEGHTADVWSVAFSPRGPLLASVGEDRSVHLWNADTRQPLPVRLGHTGTLYFAAFSPTGVLATAGRDGTVRLWNVDGK